MLALNLDMHTIEFFLFSTSLILMLVGTTNNLIPKATCNLQINLRVKLCSLCSYLETSEGVFPSFEASYVFR